MKTKCFVLVIEDDQMIREGLSEFLELEGYRVVATENGKKGLQVLRDNSDIQLILLDLQMPVMTGEEFIAEFQKIDDPRIKNIPVLVLTARVEGIKCSGNLTTIKKPIDLDELLSKIEQSCRMPALHST